MERCDEERDMDYQTEMEDDPFLSDSQDSLLHNTPPIKDERLTLDEALELCGGFGRFQLLHLICIMYIFATLAYQVLLSYFIGDNPAWICSTLKGEHHNNDTTGDFCDLNPGKIINPNNKDFHARCKLPRDRCVTVIYRTSKTILYYYDIRYLG